MVSLKPLVIIRTTKSYFQKLYIWLAECFICFYDSQINNFFCVYGVNLLIFIIPTHCILCEIRTLISLSYLFDY